MPEKNSLNGNDVINDNSSSNREDELRKLFYEVRRSRSSDACFCNDDEDDEDDNDGLE